MPPFDNAATTRPQLVRGLVLLEERNQPVLGASCAVTPYRLPHIARGYGPPQGTLARENHGLWGRHGYEDGVWGRYGEQHRGRPRAEMGVTASPVAGSPRVKSLVRQGTSRAAPPSSCASSREATLTSPTQSPQPHFYGASHGESALYRRMLLSNRERSVAEGDVGMETDRGPTTTPFRDLRAASPAKSAYSLRWTLPPYKNLHFDKKGQGKAQGPYSREFTVTCSTPNSWLRMKLGRSKSTLV